MTPIFSRNWLMKIQVVRVLLTAAVSLRKACDMSRACRPKMCIRDRLAGFFKDKSEEERGKAVYFITEERCV